MSGYFITFEGIDGCGKSTQARRLVAFFQERGIPVRHTREPGGTPFGERIREIVLSSEERRLDALTEMFLMAADRSHHVGTAILPWLKEGRIVVCERFVDSTAAYQGYGGGLPSAKIDAVNALASRGLVPDLTIVLDIEPAVALRRRGRKPDRIEARDVAYHERVRSGFLEIAQRSERSIRIIEADAGPDEVHRRVVACVRELGFFHSSAAE